MLLIDLERGQLISDGQIKRELAQGKPFAKWAATYQLSCDDLPADTAQPLERLAPAQLLQRQLACGYSQEDLKFILEPMATGAQEAVGSMGDDTPVAVLSQRPVALTRYFRQEFAQVTNPAIDPIREELVMSTYSYLGRRPNLLLINGEPRNKILRLPTPVLTVEQLQQITGLSDHTDGALHTEVLDITYPVADGWEAMAANIERLCAQAQQHVEAGVSVLVLSDRAAGAKRVAIPALLAVSAVHHHLINSGLRTQAGLVADTASVWEVHDFAVLIGFGAEAICPYPRLLDDGANPA